MGLLDIVRTGIKIADAATKDLQARIYVERYIGGDGYEELLFDPAVPLNALVEWKQRPVRTAQGEIVMSSMTIIILDVASIAAITSGGHFDTRDRFTLPDGTTAPPLVAQSGLIDRGTYQPVAMEVYFG